MIIIVKYKCGCISQFEEGLFNFLYPSDWYGNTESIEDRLKIIQSKECGMCYIRKNRKDKNNE